MRQPGSEGRYNDNARAGGRFSLLDRRLVRACALSTRGSPLNFLLRLSARPMTTEFHRDLEASLNGAYTLERDLGGGGMSRVFLARDQILGRDVVVKVLEPELARTVSAERFGHEIRIAARLQEPHIVPVLSAGVTTSGLPYYTMPFVRGESLRQRLNRAPVGAEECRSILVDVARALAYAHREGVI